MSSSDNSTRDNKGRDTNDRPRIGLALGSGSARGWAHIGVLRELEAQGIRPDVISGSSMGALVGAHYVCDSLDLIEDFALRLDRREILRYVDLKLVAGGGFVEGKRLMSYFDERIGAKQIESLSKTFAVVATDLANGQEVWFREGPLWPAVRASIALPGIFTPSKVGERWLVDGGLVNPVPISLCRAMGAEAVIAVNLNGGIVGKHLRRSEPKSDKTDTDSKQEASTEATLLERFSGELRVRANALKASMLDSEPDTPGLFDVVASSLNIMQDRITRSRMAGDPAEVILAPHLAHIGLLELDRADEAIEAGRETVRLARPALDRLLEGYT